MKKYQWIKWRRLIIWLAVIVIVGVVLIQGGPTYWNVALSLVSILFQLVLAMMFMIIQFVALFWFYQCILIAE